MTTNDRQVRAERLENEILDLLARHNLPALGEASTLIARLCKRLPNYDRLASTQLYSILLGLSLAAVLPGQCLAQFAQEINALSPVMAA